MFTAATLFATGGLFIKMIPWNPLAVNAARCSIAIWCIFFYIKKKQIPIHLNKSILIGAFCLLGTNSLYTTANKLTTAGNAIILQFTAPIFVLIFELIIFRKRPKRADILACIFVFSGVAIFFVDSLSSGHILGDIIAVISGMTYAGLFMMNDSKDASPLISVLIGNLLGILTGLPWLLKVDFPNVEAKTWLALFLLGAFQLGISYIFFTEGLKTTPPITASIVSVIEAILNPILVAIFMHEMLTPLSLLGAAFVLVSATVYSLWKMKNENQ